jgi:hypothetical protein
MVRIRNPPMPPFERRHRVYVYTIGSKAEKLRRASAASKSVPTGIASLMGLQPPT